MTDRVDALLSEGDAAEELAKQDRLLAEIEADGRVPDWAWGPMSDTVARLRELPPGCAFVATRYLQFVKARGATFFGEEHHYQAALWGEREAPTLRCRCGADAKADRPTEYRRVEILIAVCQACGMTNVQYDREPYDGPTLITAWML